MALALLQNVMTVSILFIIFHLGNEDDLVFNVLLHSEVVSLDRFCRDRAIELVPALDIEGDSIEIPRLQTLINFTQSCFPTTKYIFYFVKNNIFRAILT